MNNNLAMDSVLPNPAAAALPGGKAAPPGLGNTESIARLLFTDYLLPFEVTSVLLLVAIVGAVVLAKSRLK